MAEQAALHALAAAIRTWPSASARTDAERIVQALCGDPGVDAAVAFGSAVRSDVASFDIDLLFVYSGDRPNVYPETMEVDLRGYPYRIIEQLLTDGHDLISWSLKFGIPVCDRDGYWQGLREKWLSRLALPSGQAARDRAKKAWELFSDLL